MRVLPSDLQLAEERVRRFERLGGVDLSRIEDPDEKHETIVSARLGLAPLKKATFAYRCPMCQKVERLDTEMEPMCTGPSWTDDHPPEVMVRI